MSQLQRKNPYAGTQGQKDETQTEFSYPVGPAFVKRLADTTMACGICFYYREGRRKFCAFLGESVRPSDACRVHPAIIAEAMP